MPNCSVLVVEDDKSVRNLIVTTLQANDYPYTSAENGKEALSKIETKRPDVLLLDLGLPYRWNRGYQRTSYLVEYAYHRNQCSK